MVWFLDVYLQAEDATAVDKCLLTNLWSDIYHFFTDSYFQLDVFCTFSFKILLKWTFGFRSGDIVGQDMLKIFFHFKMTCVLFSMDYVF